MAADCWLEFACALCATWLLYHTASTSATLFVAFKASVHNTRKLLSTG